VKKGEAIYSENSVEEIQEIAAVLNGNNCTYKIVSHDNYHPVFGVNLSNSLNDILYKYSIEVPGDSAEEVRKIIQNVICSKDDGATSDFANVLPAENDASVNSVAEVMSCALLENFAKY